jgi:glutamate N-acetyltransferase / amino-acid N-acetyltransferase
VSPSASGVTAPRGFVAAGGAVGIKASGALDLAVVATEDGAPVAAAGVFTANRAAAAPVQVSRSHLAETGGHAAGVVLTSGNANAATGEPGLAAARRLCALVADSLGAAEAEVLVAQTGLIGVPFPMAEIEAGVAPVVATRAGGPGAAGQAATAILTTDTRAKEATVDGGGFSVGAMAKGAAMLAPNMATMLAVLTTDAACPPAELTELLRLAVGPTFNAMTIDGCTSTNDTVVVLANGAAGHVPRERLSEALTEACGSLARQMVEDAEGASRVAHVVVRGARSEAEAHRAARQVAGSLLVKCSLNGADPYWGRVVSELGCAGVDFDLDRVSVAYGGVVVCRHGIAARHDPDAVMAHLSGRVVEITCDLGLGAGQGAALTCDLGPGYIDENRTTS